MFFWLKKLLGYVLMPVPVVLLLVTTGAVLWYFTQRKRLGRGLVLAGFALLLLFSNKLVSLWLLRPIENRYPAIPELSPGSPLPAELSAVRYIVVLGSGNANTPGRPALSQLSQSALARIAEAVRLLRVLPEAKLVVSGPLIGAHTSHATMLARAAISLGVDPSRIELIEQVRDTEDEAFATRRAIGDAPLALVTSAAHMPRSMALFRHAGLKPLACPADFTAHDDGKWHWGDLLWDVPALERSTWAIRERLGYAWIWLRGRAG